MLSAKAVTKSFSSEAVLTGVDLVVDQGELVGLIGLSGSGKTVLARCMTGLEVFDSGEVEVDGLRIGAGTEPDDQRLPAVRRTVGFVTQNRWLPAYRTVREQVSEGPRYVLGLARRDASQRSLPWLERFGLVDHGSKYPAELSGGQLARLCLARALVMEPRYLLCDELTANLDPLRAFEVAAAVSEVAKSGVGVLLISHDIAFLSRYATRVAFLDGGRITASGAPSLLFAKPPNQRLAAFLRGSEAKGDHAGEAS